MRHAARITHVEALGRVSRARLDGGGTFDFPHDVCTFGVGDRVALRWAGVEGADTKASYSMNGVAYEHDGAGMLVSCGGLTICLPTEVPLALGDDVSVSVTRVAETKRKRRA
jgi:hypothetical protein